MSTQPPASTTTPTVAETTTTSATAPDDPLQAALLEADCLMKSLGTGSFAIDSDDEVEEEDGGAGAGKTDDLLHPLHENYVHVSAASTTTTSTATSTTTTAASGVQQQQQHQKSYSPQQFMPSSIPAVFGANSTVMSSPTNNFGTLDGSSTMHAAAAPLWNASSITTGTSSTAAPTMDTFKASTSRFASNLAQMAQRAANQVSTAVATTTQGTSSPSSLMHYGTQQQSQSFLGPPSYSTTMTPPTNVIGATGGITPIVPQPQPIATTPTSSSPAASSGGGASAAAGTVVPEWDTEQKTAWVQSHIGNLIPGERIIMFLPNVQHVSDSTGFQYNDTSTTHNLAAGASSSSQWCCAMTYYRFILFSTHPTTPIQRPDSWNAACWPCLVTEQYSGSHIQVLQIPLANIDKVEKSVFTATTPNPGPVMGGGGYGTLSVGTTPTMMNPNTMQQQNNSMSSMPTTTTTTLLGLILHDKLNGRQLRFTTTAYPDTNRAYEALNTYAFPGRRNLGYLFAFESKREIVMASIETDSTTGAKQVTLEPVKKRFDAVLEFQRQFTNANHAADGAPWSLWTTTNASYQVCSSYPSIIAGPASLDETVYPDAGSRVIRPCAAFRSEQRLPALSWCGIAGSSIWRCSQPKIGLQGNRSSADELFLRHILERAAAANAQLASSGTSAAMAIPPRSVLVQLTGSPDLSNWMPQANIGLKIMDLRPRSSAMANRTGGYGYENTSNYPGCSIQFCNIGNIHAVRDAYQKLSTLCLSTVTNDLTFMTQVEDTKWLSHIRLIWAAAWETAYWVHVHKLPVLVHCSHGWDRTSQVACLAQLLLDPFYRTQAGFATLVEKDFMSFGHPFHTRCGHGEGKDGAGGPAGGGSGLGSTIDEGQISPIFIQFLDCVYQLVRLYPEAFEFNTKYILLLSEHVYSCRFGNFLCDTEREREAVAGIRQRTHSVWDYLEEQRPDTRNPQYMAPITPDVLLMPLPTLLRNITLWTDRHCMYSPKPTTRWLPLGVHRPLSALNNDQPSNLVTEQETLHLIYSLPTKALEGATTTNNANEAVARDIASGSDVVSHSEPSKDGAIEVSSEAPTTNDPDPTANGEAAS